MAKKLFLSILGTGKYMPCRYRKDDMVLTETKFIQQALVEYLQKGKQWTNDDKVIVFLTQRAKEKHWISTEQEQGLESILSGTGVSYDSKDIPDGKSSEEMWAIFEAIYAQFEEGDELYIDITHSFRYLPMLLIVLVNYAKLLKNVSVAGIYYGNWEAKDDNGIAPIMDLLPLSVLQDWTIAASDFQQYGQVKRLSQLADNSIRNILRDEEHRTKDNITLRHFVGTLQKIVDDRLTCRGKEIIKGSDAEVLRTDVEKIETVAIAQFKPIFEQIKNTMSTFGTRNEISNCLKAAKWCLDNHLYQQCITLLKEGVVTILCDKLGLDYQKQHDRELVSHCVIIKTPTTATDKIKEEEPSDEERTKLENLLENPLWDDTELINTINDLGNIRNDYNHAGFRDNPASAKTMMKRVEEDFCKICEKFDS